MKSTTFILTLLMILSICASAVIAYATTNETTINNAKDIEELKTAINGNREQIDQNNINIAVLNTISEDVKDIKQDMRELRRG